MLWHICCAGRMTRWNNYLGIPKHLIKINGEILIERVVRLIKQYDKDAIINIYVLKLDDRYKIDGTNLVVVKPKDIKLHYKTPAIKTIMPYSSKQSNIMLFGDVYFTENSIKKIIYISKRAKNITFFGREEMSEYTLCEWGEIWGIFYDYNHINKITDSVRVLDGKYEHNEIDRVKHWGLYRLLNGIDLKANWVEKNFIEIDDFTEDFDFPIDYDRWIKQYELFKQNKIIISKRRARVMKFKARKNWL